LERERLALTPKDCYLHFRDFVSEALSEKGGVTRKHLYDILRYENVGLEVGKQTSEKSAFQIDIPRIRKFKPAKSKKIIIQEFDFNLPVIILDLIAGDFKEQYPPHKTLLVFKQDDDLLDVSEINSFTRDFLELCNGKKTVEAISEALYEHHGQEMAFNDFFDSCVEAIKILGKERLLEAG